ncbi:hypothetical protein [Altererythrobacter sp. Z27]|uniref:hypothetical protein n=1 Tax=Altererythrobacter sp. Z27 TaxID=3461147 RepID=UPI004044EDF3
MSRLAFAFLTLFASLSALTATSAPAQNAESKDRWALDSFGPQGQCGVSRVLVPNQPSQIAIGLNQDGTYLTLQNLQWQLPRKSTNMMRVKLKFENSDPIKTDALMINQIHAFQIFSILMPIEEEEIWDRMLSGEPLQVTGSFKPGSVTVQFDDLDSALPILKDCVDQFLPGRKLPFAIAAAE